MLLQRVTNVWRNRVKKIRATRGAVGVGVGVSTDGKEAADTPPAQSRHRSDASTTADPLVILLTADAAVTDSNDIRSTKVQWLVCYE